MGKQTRKCLRGGATGVERNTANSRRHKARRIEGPRLGRMETASVSCRLANSMPQYIALLRGINLGKRRIKMDALRVLFEELKFAAVATFIASGNVLFASKTTAERKLAALIQAHLAKSLGYEVGPFLRTRAEMATVAAFRPFAARELENPANTVHAGFLREPLSAAQTRELLACRTGVDEFHIASREFYWLCRIKSHESKVWASAAMKAVKLPTTTMRNLTTVRKLAAQFPATEA